MPQRTRNTRRIPSRRTPIAVKPRSAKRIVLIVVPIAILATAVITFYLVSHFNNNEDISVPATPKDTRPTVVTQDNAQTVKADMTIDKPVADGSYQVTMNTNWVFDGKSSNTYVENVKNNTRTVYFDVLRSDTNELIYSSPYIPVNEKLKGFVLNKSLAAGSYQGLVTYHLVDDNHNEVSNLSVTVSIQVK